YIDQRIEITFDNLKYKVQGILSGYDQYMNMVIENSQKIEPDGKIYPLAPNSKIILRGEKICSFEEIVGSGAFR
ncbi:MAG: Protein sidekick-2, partial [Paramarteilia canceri]